MGFGKGLCLATSCLEQGSVFVWPPTHSYAIAQRRTVCEGIQHRQYAGDCRGNPDYTGYYACQYAFLADNQSRPLGRLCVLKNIFNFEYALKIKCSQSYIYSFGYLPFPFVVHCAKRRVLFDLFNKAF